MPDSGLDALIEATRKLQEALLAYGGGDPVVVMPDGRLMRLVHDAESEADRDWAHQYQPLDPGEAVPDWPIYKLTDPVQP